MICARCGAYGRYEVFMTYMYFSFFFIPLFKWNRKYYVKMSCCGALYELNYDKGMALLRGDEAEITEADLVLAEEGRGRREYKKCSACGYETPPAAMRRRKILSSARSADSGFKMEDIGWRRE